MAAAGDGAPAALADAGDPAREARDVSADDANDCWITVCNWERFQHYHDRDPLWIKVYLDLLHRPQWLDLTWPQKGVLLAVWLTFADRRGVVRASEIGVNVTPSAARRHLKGHLKALSDAGFIRLSASKPLQQELRIRIKEGAASKEGTPTTHAGGPPESLGTLLERETNVALARAWMAEHDPERRNGAPPEPPAEEAVRERLRQQFDDAGPVPF